MTSVSLHLLGIDNGCIWRHRFVPEEGKVAPLQERLRQRAVRRARVMGDG